jgi:hypothetical protein
MMGTVFAYAGDTTPYSFSFTFDGSLQQTSSKYKATYSSVKMSANSVTSGKSYIASVQARSSGNSTVNISVGSPSYTFSNGTINNNMVNYVKEEGYNYAGIRAAQYYSDPTFYASGTWQVDLY